MNAPLIPAIPHLTTALSGPLQHLETIFIHKQIEIETWFRKQFNKTPSPFYTSVDLRNAGFKLAPVDTNLFPAGFNNLNQAFLPLGVLAVQSAIENLMPSAVRILLVAENHTRNLFYLESLAALSQMLRKAGLETRIGILAEEPHTVTLKSGREITLEPIIKVGDKAGVADFFPCMILLNNDLSAGRPEILENVDQLMVPPLDLGWSNRLKSEHFAEYQKVCEEFSELVGIDSWCINPLFRNCGEINFMKREGQDCLADNVDALMAKIRAKYKEYGVDKKPFVMVKADAGTYGMGIMTVREGDDIRELNRKQRTKMSSLKGGQTVNKVIMQEGVYTFETWDEGAIAEPVVYLIDHHVIGGFYRVHSERSDTDNLNAPGMRFEPLAFAESCITPDENKKPDAEPNRFYAYGVIARLATLAASREIASVDGSEKTA